MAPDFLHLLLLLPPILPEIYHTAVSPVRFTDPPSKSIRTFWHGYEMDVLA
jgi:hypothetical protein